MKQWEAYFVGVVSRLVQGFLYYIDVIEIFFVVVGNDSIHWSWDDVAVNLNVYFSLVMDWCHEATCQNLRQYLQSYMLPYGVTKIYDPIIIHLWYKHLKSGATVMKNQVSNIQWLLIFGWSGHVIQNDHQKAARRFDSSFTVNLELTSYIHISGGCLNI